jgi:secreted trypsin-like serine protease
VFLPIPFIDTCQGDPGGPLMMFNLNHQWELVSVVSYGRGCGLLDSPGVYTRVSFYTKWINETIQHSLSVTTTVAGLNNSASSINIPLYFLLSVFIFIFDE